MTLPRLLRPVTMCVVWLAAASLAQAQPLEITTGPDLGTHSAGPVQLQLTAQFGALPYTWSVAPGSEDDLPGGVAIRSDVPPWFPANSAALSGVTTAPGTYTFTLTVTDGNSDTASRAFTLHVTALTLTDTFSFPNAFVGVSYDYPIPLAGGSGTAAVIENPCCLLPPGLAIVNGHLTGTPSTSGFFNVSVMATDGPVTISRGFNINIYDIQISTPGVLPNGQANVAYSTPLTASGGGGSYTWQSQDIHPAFALSTGGIVSAASPPAGQYFFHATATDGTSSFTKGFMVVVLGASPGLPELTPSMLSFEDFTVGEPRSLWFNVGGGVPPYTWEVSGLPPPLALALRASDATNQFSWPNQIELTGTGLAPGTYAFSMTVTDSSPTPIEVTRQLTLTVSEITFDHPNINASLNTFFSTVLRAYGGTGASHTATIQNTQGGALPTGTSFSGATLTFSGTPVEWGGYNVQLRLDDGDGHTLNRSVHFFVNEDADGSDVNINSFRVLPDATRNEFYNFNLWHCCVPVTWSEEAGHPLPIGLTVAANGVISGTPTAPTGIYTFRIRATNVSVPTDVVIREFQLYVTPVRITSTFNLPYGNKDTAYPLPPPNGYTFTADGGATGFVWEVAENSVLPPGLSLVESNGVWTLAGTPTSAGRFSFNLLVRDQSGNSRTGFFSVEIYPPGAAPPLSFAMGSDFGTWQLGPSEFRLYATGGDGNYVWSVIDPENLPPGITLRTDPAPGPGPTPSAGLIGVATEAGVYEFDLSVTSASQTITQTFTVKITALQIRDPHPLPSAFTGENYSYTFSTTSAGTPTWDVQIGTSLPAGLTLNTSTGELHGTPTTAGTYGIHVRAYDGVDYTFSNHQLVVSAIQITTPGLLFATQGMAFSQQFVAAPGPAANYHWSIGARNPGLVMSEDGLLTGTFTFPGTHFFTITATDITTQRFYSKSIALNVVGVPAILPTLGFQDFDDWTLGQRHSLGFTTTGGTAPYTWTLLNAPPEFVHVSLRTTNTTLPPQMAELYGVVHTAGTYTFEISATDSSVPPITITRPYTIRVSELQRSFFAPLPLTFGITNPPTTLRTIGGAMGYEYEILSGKLPAGLTLSSGGVLSGTPLESGGTFARLLITDAEGRELNTGFSLFVGGGPQATVQINMGAEITATQNQGFSFTLFACCLPSYEWALEIGSTLPAGLTLSSQGVLSGIPTTAGQFLSRIRVFDPTFPANFSVREFVITVTPLTYTASTNLPVGNVGTYYEHVLADPGSTAGTLTGPITWTVMPGSSLPPGLSLTESAGDWLLSGTPSSAGQYGFSLRVSQDGHACLVNFQLSIYPAGAFPPLNLNVSGTFNQRLGRVQINLPVSNGQPPYSLAYVPGYEIPGMRVQDLDEPQPTNTPSNTGTLLGVITEPGSYTTRIRATDAADATIDRELTIVVAPITVTTQFQLPDTAVGVPYSHALLAAGGGGSYTWSMPNGFTLPAGLTLNAAGVISGPATATGTFNFTVVVSDGSTSATQGLRVNVHPFAITDANVLPIATQGTPYSVTLTGTACPCTWNQAGGSLPGGLSLSAAGVISGTPNTFGTTSFIVQATADALTSRTIVTIFTRPSTPQPITLPASPLAPTTIGNAYFTSITPRGGVAPYTWSHVSGQLPPGLELLDGSLVTNTTGHGIPHLAGVPTEVGTYTFTLEVTDSGGNPPVSAVFSVLVSPIGIEYRNLPLPNTTLRYNQAYQQRLLAIGGSGSYTWAPVGEILPGLALAASDLVSGTPLNTGSFNVPIQVADTVTLDALTLGVTFNIASDTGATLTINNGPNLGVFSQGSMNSFGLSGSGGPSSPPRIYTFSAVPGATFPTPPSGSILPEGFAIVTGDSLPGGPGGGPTSTQLVFTATTPGTFTFRLEVRDQDNNFGAKTFTLTVSPFTIFTNSTLPDATAGLSYTQPLHTWGTGGTWSVSPGSLLPAGLTLAGAVLSGTPTTAGSYSFTLRICDVASVCVSRGFTLRVASIGLTDAGVLPVATLNAPYAHTFATSGGAPQTFSIIPQPSGGLGLPPGIGSALPGGVLSGTPTNTGAFTFSVQVTDGATTFVRAFTLVVTDPNPSLLGPNPASGSDTRYITVGQSFSYVPAARLGKLPYAWAITGGSLPTGLTLYSGAQIPTNNAPGSSVIAGAPTVAGTYIVDLTATDAQGAQTTVKLTLHVTTLSLVLGSLRGGVYGEPYAQQLVAVGGTGIYTSFALVDDTRLPAGLSLNPATGLISGSTPGPTDTGNTSFTVEVTDSAGTKFRRGYNIFVRWTAAANGLDLASGVIADVSAGQGLFFTVRANGAADTNVIWSVKSGSSLPTGVDLLSGPTLPSGSPAGSAVLAGVPTTSGPHNIVLQAVDGALNFGERLFPMHVSPMQIVSLTSLRDGTVGTSYSSTPLVVAGTTTPQFDLVPTINNVPPPGLTWNVSNGVLNGTPTVAGNFLLNVRVTSGGFRLQRTLSVNIAPAGSVTPLILSSARIFPDASVNTPLAVPLDFRAAGGMKPYVWSAGSGLPTGVSLVAGSGPNSAHLIGSPTTGGPNTFTLTVTDAAGQSASGSFSMNVSALRLSPEILATGMVGATYSQPPLTVTGGTGPYVITPSLPAGLSPGMTRIIGATTVTLAGIPTMQGRFGMGFTVVDNGTGATFSRGYQVNVDAAAPATPYLALNPTGVQIQYVKGGVLPAPFPIGVTSSSTGLSFTAMLAGLPVGALSIATGVTPRTTNIVLPSAAVLDALADGVYYGVLAVSAPQSINFSVAIPVTLTISPPPPCVYTLGASPTTFSSDAHTGQTVSIATNNALCAWSAASTAPSWLHVTTPSGTGTGSVGYTVDANGNAAQRSGTITVEDKMITVTQFGTSCSVTLTPSSIAAPAGQSTPTVIVNTSAPDCSWTATTSQAWVEISSGGSGTGSGPINLMILATGDPAPRPATLDLTGMVTGTVNVLQTGLDCTVALSDSSVSVPANGGSHNVTVDSAPCGYTTVAPPQVTVTSGGSSPGPVVAFDVAANNSTQPRTITMLIGGTSFYIEQPGIACNLSVNGSNPLFVASGGAGSLSIGAPAATCDWSSQSGATWVTITQGATGAGNGTVAFSVAQNPSITPRSTTVTVAGTEVPINQDGTACSYSLRSTSATVPVGIASGTVGVVALPACAWTSTSNAGWLAITTESPNAGTVDVAFIASANPSAAPRTGTMTIAGHTFTVTQPGAPCSYSLSSSSAGAAAAGDAGSFTFSTSTLGCTPSVQSYNSWIEADGSFAGTSGTVTYTVQPNPFVIDRVGRILVGDQTFTITQIRSISCAYSLHAPSATFGAAGGNGEVLATGTDVLCTPAVGASPEIALGPLTLPPPTFVQPYTVQPFVSSVIWVRTMTINFGGVNFAVKQTSW